LNKRLFHGRNNALKDDWELKQDQMIMVAIKRRLQPSWSCFRQTNLN